MKVAFDLYHKKNSNLNVIKLGTSYHISIDDGEGNKITIIMSEEQYTEFFLTVTES